MVDLFCSGVWEHLVPTEAPAQTNLELDSSELSPSYIFNPDPYIRCLYSYLTGAPVPMVTLEPPAPKTWTSAIRRTSATTASAATSQAALSASVGPATRGPFATMSLTSVSPTLAWSVVSTFPRIPHSSDIDNPLCAAWELHQPGEQLPMRLSPWLRR